MMDDKVLLAQYVATKDPRAFEELTRRCAGLVKAVCQRVLGNSHDAEEVAQECFLELARDARHVHSSVAGWLHRAATTRSLNAARSRSRRKLRERQCSAGAEANSAATDATTRELCRVIDGALTSMPDDLRLPMILHFLDGRSQRDVALELGVNQSTISRRMRDALRQLRDKLTQAGYAASLPAIMVAMQNQADAVSETPIVTIAVAGTAGKAAGSTTVLGAIKTSLAVVLPLLSFLLFGGWISLLLALVTVSYTTRFRPLWLGEVFSSLGIKNVYEQPTFCLTRWDWTTPPSNWRTDVQTSMVWSTVFLGLSIVFAFGTSQPPWGIVVLGAGASVGFLGHAFRIVYRVNRNSTCGELKQPCANDCRNSVGFWQQIVGADWDDSNLTWFDAIQLLVIGLAAVFITGQVVVRSQGGDLWPSVVLSGLLGGPMLLWGSCILHRLSRTRHRDVEDSVATNETARPSQATQRVLTIGAATVTSLTIWILWNPAAVRGLALSLAAVQTSILGWMLYRLAASCHRFELQHVRRVVIALVVGCLVLNSSVCLANWLRPF